MTDKPWPELVREYLPELAALSDEDKAFFDAETALPSWIKYLMAAQLDAVANHPNGCRAYGRRAVEQGASPVQVAEAVKMLRIFGGRPAMVTGAEALRDLP